MTTTHRVNRIARDLAVEHSLDAAIEIDEVIRGERHESPAFTNLISNLIGLPGRELNTIKKDLLSDFRLASLYHRAAALSWKADASVQDLDRLLEVLFSASSTGLSNISKDELTLVRDFCLALNQELVSEAFSRAPEPFLARTRQRRCAPIDAC